MKVHELNVTKNRTGKRLGRGISSGRGKTAGRGTKGYGSRTGSTRKPGFEGGQNPLMKRLPKLRGFRSFRAPTETVYTGQLEGVQGTVTNAALFEAGIVSNPYTRVKLVVRGDISKKYTVKLQAASAAAVAALQKAGGTFETVEQQKRPSTKKTEDK